MRLLRKQRKCVELRKKRWLLNLSQAFIFKKHSQTFCARLSFLSFIKRQFPYRMLDGQGRKVSGGDEREGMTGVPVIETDTKTSTEGYKFLILSIASSFSLIKLIVSYSQQITRFRKFIKWLFMIIDDHLIVHPSVIFDSQCIANLEFLYTCSVSTVNILMITM